MKTPDKLPEVRRSKIVLCAVAIAAVIAMTVIQVKKMLDSEEKSSQKPVAAAPEKAGEDSNQDKKPVPQDSAIAKDASPESLIEDDEFIGDCKPASLQDACAILREADVNSVQCDIYTAVNQAFAFSYEGKTLEDSLYGSIEDVFRDCDLNEEEQKKVLRAGIQQGDTNIGEFVRDEWIGRKCDDLYSNSIDYEKNEYRHEIERAVCEEMPPDATYEDLLKIDTAACKIAEEEEKKHCEGSKYPLVCKTEAQDHYRDCFNALVPGLSYEVAKKTPGTQLYCSATVEREYDERSTEWVKRCYRNLSEDIGVEWKDVESLYKTKTAEDFMNVAQRRDDCKDVHGYISVLYWLDVQHPDVLSVLGVQSPNDVAYQYIDDEIEGCVLSQYDEALNYCSEKPSYLSCSWRDRELWEYGGTYSDMIDIKEGKYPMSGSECTEHDLYCDENELF